MGHTILMHIIIYRVVTKPGHEVAFKKLAEDVLIPAEFPAKMNALIEEDEDLV
jgi:hypothetical protein